MPPPSYKDVFLNKAKAIPIVCSRCFATADEHVCRICQDVHCQVYCCGCRGFKTKTEQVFHKKQYQPKPYGGSGPQWYDLKCAWCGFIYVTSFF